jgi:hypothetical protein
MRRSLHIGIFIGTLLGMSACAAPGPHDGTVAGPYGSVEAGSHR